MSSKAIETSNQGKQPIVSPDYLEDLRIDYNGSVQRLHFLNERIIIAETTPGGSVFDVGHIFDIPGSDFARTSMRHAIFTVLANPKRWIDLSEYVIEAFPDMISILESETYEMFTSRGVSTHYIGLINPVTGVAQTEEVPKVTSKYVALKRFPVIKPKAVKVSDKLLWDYSISTKALLNVIPLEIILRFGITKLSSVYKKYSKLTTEEEKNKYLSSIGFNEPLVPGELFKILKPDFTTKYEDISGDRNLSLQEAFYISGLNHELFKELIEMVILASLMVSKFFLDMGLTLWDIKWETAVEKNFNKLYFIDTIDSDSVRVSLNVNYNNVNYAVQMNKQSMRDYYSIMFPEWINAISNAKKIASETGGDFREHLEKIYPKTPVVDPEFIDIQSYKFNTYQEYIQGDIPSDIAKQYFNNIGILEIKYYEDKGNLDKYAKLYALN